MLARQTLSASTLVIAYSIFANSLAAAPARASAKATQLFVPVGYDDNDEVVVVVEGYLENTCESIRGAKVTRTGQVFTIEPKTETHGTDCDKLKSPYTLDVVLNPEAPLAAADDYTVEVSGSRGKMLTEPLTVEKAPVNAADSFPYAPVDTVDVGLLSGGKMRAVIEGRYQNTCVVMDRIELGTKNGKTYEMRPITRRLATAPDGSPCSHKERGFTEQKDFTEPVPGRYLLHVRAAGRSINRVFTNLW